jgi:hypothetical protein
MSQQYDNNMRGVLFKNLDRNSDSQPDYKGKAEVNGVEFWLSAWVREGQKGKFMSLSFTPKDDAKAPTNRGAQHKNGTTREERSRDIRDMDSDIPF